MGMKLMVWRYKTITAQYEDMKSAHRRVQNPDMEVREVSLEEVTSNLRIKNGKT